MRLRFWGVRGSIPVPGAHTSRYGGNTSCVEVRQEGEASVVLDCGTGARALGQQLVQRPQRELHLLFTHFHMDHVFGFPFFTPVFAPSFKIDVTAPTFSPDATRDRLARYLNGVFHPVRVSELMAGFTFDHIRPNQVVHRGNYRITAVQLHHPGGSCGYVVEHSGVKIAYLTDTSPLSRPGEGLAGGLPPTSAEARVVQAISNADAVVMDTMFSESEYFEKMSWGHSYPEYGVALAKAAKVKRLYLFHHSPDARDEDLDELGVRWSEEAELKVEVAYEGLDVELGGPPWSTSTKP